MTSLEFHSSPSWNIFWRNTPRWSSARRSFSSRRRWRNIWRREPSNRWMSNFIRLSYKRSRRRHRVKSGRNFNEKTCNATALFLKHLGVVSGAWTSQNPKNTVFLKSLLEVVTFFGESYRVWFTDAHLKCVRTRLTLVLFVAAEGQRPFRKLRHREAVRL